MKPKGPSRDSNERRRRSRIYIKEDSDDEPRKSSKKKQPSKEKRNPMQHVQEHTKSMGGLADPDTGPAKRSGTPVPLSAYNTSESVSPQFSDSHESRTIHRTGRDTPRRQMSGQDAQATKQSQARPRTRTLEEHLKERSPGSSRTRVRMSSLQSPPSQDNGSVSSSIGFPSIVSSPALEAQRRPRPSRPPSRPLSPIRNPIAAKPGTPLSSSSTDAKKILQLMKTTCGRMQGVLSFRNSVASPWASGYCAINVASGSLIYQTKGEVNLAKTLINDLRGCQVRTLYDAESRSTFLAVSTLRTTSGIHLKPHVPETFDQWLAALLCWQPIRPKGAQNKMSKPQDPKIGEKKLGDGKGDSDGASGKDASIIKVGKMLMWEKNPQPRSTSPLPTDRRVSIYRPIKSLSKNWRKVSCTLQENGHFKIYLEPESTLEAVIPLSQLSRCAVQRLDPSILDDEYCIAIYTQYTLTNSSINSVSSIYFSLDSRVLFEVWFVLLRAFTVPELYGPDQLSIDSQSRALDSASASANPPPTDMFRVERILSLRIIEAKLDGPRQNSSHGPEKHLKPQGWKPQTTGNYYAEIQFDGEVRARTSTKPETSNPFFREDFEFSDLPPVFSSSAIELKSRNPGQKAWSLTRAPSDLKRGDINPATIDGDVQVSPLDLVYGKVDIRLDSLERATDTERWWQLINDQEDVVGEMLMRIRVDELVVSMGRDYAMISETLHSFSNGLTNQITQVAHIELKRLSEILLNIFQVSGHASAWLMSLVEEEIDTSHKETPMSKFRYRRGIASQDALESSVEREMWVRDMGKNATIEANLLFRGNTLLTKALDSHMRRLGKEYLDETLSERMRDIAESDPDCEVDPHRVSSSDDLQRNWRNLTALTENVWQAVLASAPRCPPELRIIFRRIRDCAEDRYGGFLRTVAYSSVSGFLFLRFFCPAVLNPKLFGLLKDHPRPRAQRTLTLITKTLQMLANLNTFGSKEPWMEPMNVFLTSHRPGFKAFIDKVCDISSERATSAIPPSYATPITILNRLPGTSKEGFPSLPYLIDQARECANLVDVWLDARHEVDSGVEWSKELQYFDELCEASRDKARECLSRAEQAERPSGVLEPKWEELVEQMERKARFREANGSNGSPNTPAGDGSGSRTLNSSTSSFADSYFHQRHHANRSSPAASRLAIARSPISPSSPLSVEEITSEETGSETTGTPPGSSSGAWDSGTSPTFPDTVKRRNQHRILQDEEDGEEDEDFSDLDIENNSDILGSSIYSLGKTRSKRDSAATNKTITPATKYFAPINSKWRHHQEKGQQSQYSLQRSAERAEMARHKAGMANRSRDETPSGEGRACID
ncbi:uncharacterized protein KY384_006074 [Bacidia gigantensis]|uniref:uncharacterized protein n=1 Tax=Bacidia gigantensis TaxID=2732470 RepID=UPI001D04BA80|nr:uncharacterized protein KY384_006074 [Bacidia gigantensis]KAG8529437.1 hypothetical protein KY384_006074 [Bacidia gigantensis]